MTVILITIIDAPNKAPNKALPTKYPATLPMEALVAQIKCGLFVISIINTDLNF